MTGPRVSVVIPTYNQADFLRECLASLLAQTVSDWEAIVVNNFSEDHTEQVVHEMDDPRISIVNFRNEGVIAASRNVGVGKARGEWIAFLDSDDEWLPEKLERCLAAATPDVDVVAHPVRMHRDGRVLRDYGAEDPSCAEFRRLLFDRNCLTPSASLVRCSAIERAGGLSEDREMISAEDYDLWLRLAHQGMAVRTVAEPLTRYRVHTGSSSRSAERHMNATLAVIDHHFSRLVADGENRPWDRLRWRRVRGRAVYGAARLLQKAGRRQSAFLYFLRALATYPFLPRAFVGMALLPFGSLREAALWGWVGIAFLAYMVQFQDLVFKIIKALV